jgi:hypothetical protein
MMGINIFFPFLVFSSLLETKGKKIKGECGATLLTCHTTWFCGGKPMKELKLDPLEWEW